MKKQNENIKYQETFTVDLYLLEGMPDGIHGVVMPEKKPQRYKIGLKADADETQRLATFLHEMVHIYNHDMDRGGDVSEIEWRTRRQLLEALELLKQETQNNSNSNNME